MTEMHRLLAFGEAFLFSRKAQILILPLFLGSGAPFPSSSRPLPLCLRGDLPFREAGAFLAGIAGYEEGRGHTSKVPTAVWPAFLPGALLLSLLPPQDSSRHLRSRLGSPAHFPSQSAPSRPRHWLFLLSSFLTLSLILQSQWMSPLCLNVLLIGEKSSSPTLQIHLR